MSPVAIPTAPDTVAVFRQLLLDRSSEAGDTPPVIRSVRAAGDEPPYTLAREAGEVRAKNAPVRPYARVAISVYDTDPGAAAARYRRFSMLLHGYGPAIVDGGDGNVGVWRVWDETGPQPPVQEPATGWWVVGGVFDLVMTDRTLG